MPRHFEFPWAVASLGLLLPVLLPLPVSLAATPTDQARAQKAPGMGEKKDYVPEEDSASAPGSENPAPGAGSPAALSGAIATLQQELAKNPGDAVSHYRLGLLLRRMGKKPEALPHFERAVAIGPATVERLLDLGIAYSDVARFSDAEGAYHRLLAIEPGHPKALHNLGNIALRRGDFEQAGEAYRKALAADPAYMLARYHLAYCLKFMGKNREAEETYVEVLKSSPRSDRELAARTDSFYQLGVLALADGAFEQAEKLLAQCIKIAPDHPGAHYARAQALLELGRDGEAQEEIAIHMKLLAARPQKGPVATSSTP